MRLAYLHEWWPADPFKMSIQKILGKIEPNIGAQYSVPAAQEETEEEIEEVEQEIETEQDAALFNEGLRFKPKPGDWVMVSERADKQHAIFWHFTGTCPACNGAGATMIGGERVGKCWSCWGSGAKGDIYAMPRSIMGYMGPNGEIPENPVDVNGQPVQI